MDVPRSRADLSELQLAYLQSVRDHFRRIGEWPVSHSLARSLVRQMDIREVERSLPSGFIYGQDTYYPDRKVALTLPALETLGEADEELTAFLQALRLCIERYFNDSDPHPQLASDDLRTAFDMPDLLVRKVHALLQQEQLLSGGSIDLAGDQWQYDIANTVRPFLEVASIDEYLKVRQQQKTGILTTTEISSRGTQTSNTFGLVQLSPMVIHDEDLRRRCADLLAADSDHDRAILEACVILEHRVREAINADASLHGTALMEHAFSQKRPRLRLSLDDNEQRGAMDLYRGTIAFFRNIAGHRITEMYSREDAQCFVLWVDLLLKMMKLSITNGDVSRPRLDTT